MIRGFLWTLWMPALGIAAPVLAQTSDAPATTDNGLDEIVVTAQKRSENLQSTPIAISAYSADTLAKAGATGLVDVIQMTPTLYSQPYPTSSSTLFLFMRGQGIGDPMQITKDGSIGVYIDGVYSSRPQTSAFDLADVERVEVLRGPQGTLYGRNTTGGAINIISKAPTGDFGVRSTLRYGARDDIRSLTNVDLPALGNLAAKLTFLINSKDGYVKNIGPSHDFNEASEVSGRLALRWQPSADFSADYSLSMGRNRSTPIYFSNASLEGVLPGYEATHYRTYRPVDLKPSTTDFRDHTLILSKDIGNALTIRSLTGYRYLKFGLYDDFVEAFGFPFVVEDAITSKQFSEDLQLVGTMADGRVKYVGGAFYFRERARHREDLTSFGASRQVNAMSTSTALYGQVTWTPAILSDRLELTFGGRYTWDQRRASRDQSAGGFPFEVNVRNRQSFEKFNPSAIVNFAITPDISVYGKISTGYKAGGSSESSSDFTQTFGPENVTSYEVGLKSNLFDRHVRLNIAAFYSDFTEIQLDVSTDPNDPSIGATINAGKVGIVGAELDLTVAPIRDLTLTGSYAYLHTDMKQVTIPGVTFNGSSNLAPLFAIPYAPKHSLSLSADWTMVRFAAGEFSVNANYQYKSSVIQSAGAGPAVVGREFYQAPGYGLLNGRLTFTRPVSGSEGRWRFSVWGKNILNSRYVVQKGAVGSQSTGYFSELRAYGEPLSYGVEIGVDF